MHNLTYEVKTVRIMNAVAAGTSDQTSSALDTQGYEGVRFIALFGALTATQVTSIKAQQSSDDGSSDAYSDIAGSGSAALDDADGNQMLILDIYQPQKRYLKLVVDRGTANAVIDGVIAELYRPRVMPVTADSSVSSQELLAAPAEGTA